MALTTIELEDQLRAIDAMIVELRRSAGIRVADGPSHEEARVRYEVLKAIAADLRGRLDRPRSLALGEIERAIRRMLATKGPLGYADGQMLALASCLTRHWPFVRQALEHYGEASAE